MLTSRWPDVWVPEHVDDHSRHPANVTPTPGIRARDEDLSAISRMVRAAVTGRAQAQRSTASVGGNILSTLTFFLQDQVHIDGVSTDPAAVPADGVAPGRWWQGQLERRCGGDLDHAGVRVHRTADEQGKAKGQAER